MYTREVPTLNVSWLGDWTKTTGRYDLHDPTLELDPLAHYRLLKSSGASTVVKALISNNEKGLRAYL